MDEPILSFYSSTLIRVYVLKNPVMETGAVSKYERIVGQTEIHLPQDAFELLLHVLKNSFQI